MESLDYWRLCEQLSVSQAALLITGTDPSTIVGWADDEPWNLPKGFLAARSALENAVATGVVQATIRRQSYSSLGTLPPGGQADLLGDFWQAQAIEELAIDWTATRLEVTSLKRWLQGKGFTEGFFFPAGVPAAEYLDQDDPSFAPKLAAAVRAWEALRADPALLRGRSPKQALVRWLNQHASELGLADEDGVPIGKAVEDVATVANWNTTGGAPKTPSSAEVRISEPTPPF